MSCCPPGRHPTRTSSAGSRCCAADRRRRAAGFGAVPWPVRVVTAIVSRRLVDEVAVSGPPLGAGALVLSAWPEQLAAARPERRGGYLLAGGRGAELPVTDPLAGAPWLAVAHLDRGQRTARIHLAAALDLTEVRAVLRDRTAEQRQVAWRGGDVVAERREQVGAVVLERARLQAPDADLVLAALLDGLRQEGLGLLDVRAEDRQLQARADLVRRVLATGWPTLDDDDLLEAAEDVLGPFLLSVRNRAELSRVRLATVLVARLGPRRLQQLDHLAPTHLEVPSGSRRRLDYVPGDRPVLAVRVQELFGATTTPTVVDGRVGVLLHLLSPAGRPVQVTDDLAGFWARGYPQVRAELRGRYPKHAWPEDPLAADALRGTPRRR
jgi:ATP-dependent helicase HrpB